MKKGTIVLIRLYKTGDTDKSYVDETIHYIITDTADNKGIFHRIIYIQTNKQKKYYGQKRKNH